MSDEALDERAVTEAGNPACPTGEYGARMLHRMNESHGPMTEWALGFLRLGAGARALDVGCGGGATLGRLLGLVGEGGRVSGIDYSPVSVAESRSLNAAAVAAGRVDVTQASVDCLPFADASFDAVTTVESFYFWPDPERGLAEVARVLRPGGTFLLVADVYQRPGLPAEVLENQRRYGLTILEPEEYEALLCGAGFSCAAAHTREPEGWICVEGTR